MPDESPTRRFASTLVEVEGREERHVVELPAFDMVPWGREASLTTVGASATRVDAADKVTGRARYTADITPTGVLHAVLVRSPIARGRVVTLHAEAARKAPGVIDVLTGRDVPKVRVGGGVLFDRTIAFAGQPLAVVCAESLEEARAAAQLVDVEIEAENAVVSFADATAAGAPPVRKGGNLSRSSPSVRERGNADRGLAAAEVVVRRRFHLASALHSAMEPHGAVAEWQGDVLTIWESTQAVFNVRDEVATGLGLPQSRVRVLMEHMGGGFGAKSGAGAHTFAAALCARRTGRPVRCVLDRHGEQVATGHRPETVIEVTLGARRDGRLTAIVATAEVALGVGGWEASPTAMCHELYACPDVRTTDQFAYVNQQAMASFRGPGHVECAVALEGTMDAMARALGMDPLALRLLNYATHDEGRGRPFSSADVRACTEEGARRFGWRERRVQGFGTGGVEMMTRSGDSAANFQLGGGPGAPLGARRRGVGMAAQTWSAGGGPPAYATARFNTDGTLDIACGTQDLGTGARTILAQIAAEASGARLSEVRVILGDTERTPYCGPSWGSMTTASVGPAVRMASEDARRKLIEAAAEMMDCDPATLVTEQGVVRRAAGGTSMTFAEVTEALGDVMLFGHGSRGPNPGDLALVSVGAQFAEVEVDVETGVVRVLQLTAVHDVGRVINPVLAESQLVGGILQGIGYALHEERRVDPRDGRPLTTGLHDYKVPTLRDVPVIDARCLDRPDPAANAIGSRGLAEPPIIPTAAAILNAVSDALGVEVTSLPLTPWRLLDAVRAAAVA